MTCTGSGLSAAMPREPAATGSGSRPAPADFRKLEISGGRRELALFRARPQPVAEQLQIASVHGRTNLCAVPGDFRDHPQDHDDVLHGDALAHVAVHASAVDQPREAGLERSARHASVG